MKDTISDQLRRIFDRDRILDSDLWREIYARDASYFDIKPLATVRPRTIEEVQQVLALARRNGIGVTFRAAGTSLSGQTVGSGIICELRGEWNRSEVRDNGKRIWFEPGLTANQVNSILRPHRHHIGPDPASSQAAMMGGILNNNSSGMEAGVKYNSYHTMASVEFMLANGHRYNSASPDDRRRFEEQERELCQGLMKIREEIMNDDETREKIIRKYKIKNVTGYSMNAFVDFDNPMDIFIHALIGSEGTLAFIISAELNTRPLLSTYSSTMLYFPSVTAAASHAAWLGESGALAVEMMDYDSICSSVGTQTDMPRGTTALLVDYGADSSAEMEEIISRMQPQLKNLKGLSRMDDFTHTVEQRAELWRIRNGVFPCVAGARVPGSAVILEDIAAPVEDLDKLVNGVEQLFKKHGYEGAIFGHARDGNIHPLVTAPMKSAKEVDNFKRFIEGFVDHTLSLEGSLKGEHGTGRAMAPFVEKEWGEKIYAHMRTLKHLADPQNILNPGVIINDDPECFIRPMKSLDLFGDKLGYKRADKCMECGYCEHVCPSRYVTLTPRQRLQARRIIARTGSKELEKEYRYIGRETCCSDGSCMLPCPMQINTGEVTDAVRRISDSSLYEKALSNSAGNYGAVESAIRGVLRLAVTTQKVISPYPLIWATDFMHRLYDQVPHWTKYFPMPAKINWYESANPDFVYFPACVTRIFGGSNLGKDDLITVMMRIARRAGISMSLPKEMHGLCCSQIWEHKGDPEGQKIVANKLVEAFYRLTDGGKIPIVCDTTSCTHTLLTLHHKEALTEENKQKYEKIKIFDVTLWLADIVLPKVDVSRKKKRVALHPTCASRLAGLDKDMIRIAQACAEECVVPDDAYCCGAAGDRGFIYPEIAKGATRDELKDLKGEQFDGYYSLARTCEISMQSNMNLPYESIVYLVDETTTPKLK